MIEDAEKQFAEAENERERLLQSRKKILKKYKSMAK